ncbi:hypothetical protein DPMN_008611 [Dreissena polymorpha]|uniref:Uncharacterized protein n=1 Tax=Dreissena polymorpha TaxID=45954 RepID=A0A9D4RZU7_DREPO|nr:hypothetical protein DPMN_008611 [Dreissena polymorpha]
MMSADGSTRKDGRRTIQKLSQVAERSSSWFGSGVRTQLGRRKAIDIHTFATVAPHPRCPWFRGET